MKNLDKVNIIITGEDKPNGFASLNKLDAKISHYPMIKTSACKEIQGFDIKEIEFIIFTSKKGIKYFFDNQNSNNQDFSLKKFICLGEKTEKELNEYNYKAYYTCKRNYSETMCEELKKSKIIESKNVLLVQGNLANKNLVNCLKAFSNSIRRNYYNTALIDSEYKELKSLIETEKTYTVFTSPSSFNSFIKIYDANKTNIISIGTTTSSFIEHNGYKPLITSKMQSYEGIAESIINFFLKEYDYEIS